MNDELNDLLRVRGYERRDPQTRLFEHLISADRMGVIAQAGTGVGKSIAVLAAAANRARKTERQSIVVTPTLTLMNQYRDGDMPQAQEAFADLAIAEIRGMSHYRCELTSMMQAKMGIEHELGCLGQDVGCSQSSWEESRDWECGYREARYEAARSDIVVTNSDMLIANDRMMAAYGSNFLDLDGTLLVDEAHTLEQKLRDYGSRSLHYTTIGTFRYASDRLVRSLKAWLDASQDDRDCLLSDAKGFPIEALAAIANSEVPPVTNGGDLNTSQMAIQESAARILEYIRDPHDGAVVYISGGSIKFDWVNISRSAAELLTARDFGLVSATVPKTMAAGLGVPGARFVDVGHPFDYARQAWIGFSPYGGDYRSAQHDSNFETRVKEVEDIVCRSKGGALLLFSSFSDLERVHDRLAPLLRDVMGLTVLKQERGMAPEERQEIADRFKQDGNAVMFGSESFATGFDVPGSALRLVVIWKLPYPAMDPVSNAIRAQSYQRYEDMMRVRAVQGIGRLIRRETDSGVVWIADNRGRRLMDTSDPLTSHLPQFSRL